MTILDAAYAPLAELLALGLIVGFISGMFGVGGGFLLTPLLNLALGIPYPIAVGSGLCQMIGTATSAYLRHRSLRLGEPRVGWIMLGGSLVGVHAGTDALRALGALGRWTINGQSLPAVKLVLQPAYVVVLAATAVLMLAEGIRARRGGSESPRRAPLARLRLPPYLALKRVSLAQVSVPVLAYLGLLMGFLSGLLGIGGGVALMPALIYGLGFPIRHAAGTGLALLICTAMVGTVAQAMAGHVSLSVALPLLLSSSLGAQFGATTTHRLPGASLRITFALVVLATVAILLLDLARAILR